MNLISRTNKQTKIVKTIILFFFLFFSFQISVRAAVNCSSLTNSGTVTISWTDSYCFFGQPGNASNTSGAADDATYTNDGTISLRYRNVRGFYNGFDNTKMINNGTIESNAQHRYGYQSAFHDEGDDGESINNGTINLDYGASGGNGNNGAFRMNIGSGQSFTNSSGASVTVIGSNGNPGGLIQSDNTTVTNNGTFTIGGSGTTQKAIRYYDTADGQTLINTGTITQSGSTDAILNEGTNAVITNTGTINGAVYDINNTGTITTLTNDQGGSDSLTFDGTVPTNYNVILNSTSDFGKVDFSNESGSLTFGIDSSSSLAKNTYSAVLQKIAASNIGNEATWTNYNSALKWRLVANGSDWDLEIASRRTGYKVRIPKTRFSAIATVLENFNTNGTKSTLTSNLDSLSDTALEKAMRQIKGMTIQKSIGQSVRSNNSFKRAMTSAVKGPSFGQLVQNNFASLSFDDVQNYYNPGEERINLTNDFTISDIANIYSKRNLLQIGAPDNSFYLRTFGGVTDQEKVGDDIGYVSTTAGFVFGNQTIIDNLQAGWGLGFSTTGLDYDEGYGLNSTHSLHANFFANKEYKKFDTSLNLGSFVSKNNSTRNVTEGSTQTLKSDRYELGLDLTGGISKKINLGGWVLNPTATINTAYVLQEDIDESGGDLALKIKTDNLLQIKPELGFNLDREFSNNGFISKGFNLSLFGSEENKLDGADSTATIKDTGDGYALTENKKRDQFVTAGLGFSSINQKNNSQFLINAFGTQNTSNDMNSSLISFTYNKKF
tara:strand:- start:870 stop:3200 length:2331 start_codon:yes stop_codon:yes gene_type:complete